MYASGSPSSNLHGNFIFLRQLRCLENEIMGRNKQASLDILLRHSLTQDFFRQARRLRRERREHTDWYVTNAA